MNYILNIMLCLKMFPLHHDQHLQRYCFYYSIYLTRQLGEENSQRQYNIVLVCQYFQFSLGPRTGKCFLKTNVLSKQQNHTKSLLILFFHIPCLSLWITLSCKLQISDKDVDFKSKYFTCSSEKWFKS